MIKKNPNIKPDVTSNLENIAFQRHRDLFYHTPSSTFQTYVAAFDIDWTLSYAEKKLFPKDPDDIHILPNRIEKLTHLFKLGYSIALFTNQKVKSDKQKLERVDRITTLIKKLNIPCFAFISTGDDEYRKPNIGMWNKLHEFIPDIEYAFFVGDALGRPQDFSDSDKQFALNANIPYCSPDIFFDHDIIIFNQIKNMVILVGMQASGKTSYVNEHLLPLGFAHISRDAFGGNKKRVLTEINKIVCKEQSLVIDATNPKQSDRQEYYDIAEKFGYNITVLYFVRDGSGWNKLRDDNQRVPTICYHVYFKNLEPPTFENTPGDVLLID